MKRIVLVDGENLTHGLRRLLGGDVAVARTELADYDYRGLIEELLVDERPSEILWFGARLRQYNQTEEMYRKSKEAIAQQAEFINQEAKRLGAKIMHVGYEIQPVMALSQVADRTRLITAPLAKKYMKTKDES